MLADSHCHFNDLPFPEKAAAEAGKKGVQLVVSNSVDLESCQRNLELAGRYPILLPCFGLHPSTCVKQSRAENEKTLDWIEKELELDKKSQVGEIGLDFRKTITAEQRALQQYWFERQLELANRFERAASVHCRNATQEALEILEKKECKRALLHWFEGNKEELERICEKDFFVSIGPAVFSQQKIQRIASLVPLENLLLETDAPTRFSQQPSEPSWIPQVAQKTAEIRQIPLETVESVTGENSQRFFGRRTNF